MGYLMLGFHGGKCCGMKTIFGFGTHPEDTVPALEAIETDNSDSYGYSVTSSKRFFTEEAPKETTLQRLDRYLEYLDRRRPKGVTEVVLASMVSYMGRHSTGGIVKQVDLWRPYVEERGFRLVNECKNSNSQNTIYIFHRNSGEVPKAVLPENKDEQQSQEDTDTDTEDDGVQTTEAVSADAVLAWADRQPRRRRSRAAVAVSESEYAIPC